MDYFIVWVSAISCKMGKYKVFFNIHLSILPNGFCMNLFFFQNLQCYLFFPRVLFRELLKSQHSVGMIVEMIHTASLVHDDVIDGSETRRGKITVNKIWGERKVSITTRKLFVKK